MALLPGLFDPPSPRPTFWRQTVPTPLGPMVLLATQEELVLVEFDEGDWPERQARSLAKYLDGPTEPAPNAVTKEAARQLDAYFAGGLTTFDLPLGLYGTDFQKQVWTALLGIRFGQTATYAQLAEALGKEGASRAVGQANGDNRLAVVVPCHRVIRADGHMCGYAGGVWRKQKLLALESGQPPLL